MPLRRFRTGMTACLLLAALPGYARAGNGSGFARALVPDHARLQFAGAQGLLSAGAGYSFFGDRLQADLLYGYAPASVAGRNIHSVSQKSTAAPVTLEASRLISITPFLAGYSANVGLGDSYFLFLPKRYRDYYWPSALRFWFFGGARALVAVPGPTPVQAVAATAEVGAHDIYWQAWYANDSVRLREILSLSLAVLVHFRGP